MLRQIRGIDYNIFLLGVVSLITDMSSEMIAPILPFFITAIGGAGIAIGLIGGVGDSLSSLVRVFSGYFSDKIGKRKEFIFTGYFTSSVSKLFFPLATSWFHLAILRPIERIGKGVRTPARDALIADLSKKADRGKSFGFHRTMDTTGAIIGAASALLIILIYNIYSKTTETSILRVILMIAAIISFLALIPLWFVKEKKKKREGSTFLLRIKGLSKDFRSFVIVSTIFALGNFTYMFFILKAGEGLQKYFAINESMLLAIGLYILYNIFYAFFSTPAGILSDKIGRKKVIIIGYTLFGLTCLGFFLIGSPILYLILFSIYGMFYAFTEGPQRAIAADLSAKQHGIALGTYHTFTGLATLPASVIAGVLWEYFGAQYTFLYGLTISIIAIFLAIKLIKE
jgi:MFS family permease